MLPLETKAFICAIICIGILLLLFYDSTITCRKQLEKFAHAYADTRTKNIEPYEDSCGNKPAYEDYEVVMDVYRELFGRRPTSQELADYGVRIHTGAMNRESLVKHLKQTYEYKQRKGIESDADQVTNTTLLPDVNDPDRVYVMNAVITILTQIPSEDDLETYMDTYKTKYKRDKVKFEGWLRTNRVASDSVKEYDFRPEIRSTFIRAMGREPTEPEFLRYKTQFKNGSMTTTSLYMELTNTTTNTTTTTTTKPTPDASVPTSVTKPTTTTTTNTSTNATADRLRVSQIYRDVFLKSPTEVDVSFYVQKYIALNRDETKLIQYMKETPEYRLVVKKSLDTTDNNEMMMKIFEEVSRVYVPTGNLASTATNVANAAIDLRNLEENTSTPTPTNNSSKTATTPSVPASSKPIATSRYTKDDLLPIDKSSFEEQDVDLPIPDITNDPEALATYRMRRHWDQMRMECGKEKSMKQYTNATNDLVLIPGQEWSVPQPRPPICYQPKCNTSPLNSQTALLGTLLEDAANTEVGSIMPKFTFTENK